ncbi:hypothetical protein GEMRC1_004145 [Eukaryota sp. GEM-RC1]
MTGIVYKALDDSDLSVEDFELVCGTIAEKALKVLVDQYHPSGTLSPFFERLLSLISFCVSCSDVSVDEELKSVITQSVSSFHLCPFFLSSILGGFDANPYQASFLSCHLSLLLSALATSLTKPALKATSLGLGCMLSIISVSNHFEEIVENDAFKKLLSFELLNDSVAKEYPNVVALSISHVARHVLPRLYTADTNEELEALVKKSRHLLSVCSFLLTFKDSSVQDAAFLGVSQIVSICPGLLNNFIASYCNHVLDVQNTEHLTSPGHLRRMFLDLFTLPPTSYVFIRHLCFIPPSFAYRFLQTAENFSTTLTFHSYDRVINQLLHMCNSSVSPTRFEAVHSLFKCSSFTALLPQEGVAKAVTSFVAPTVQCITEEDLKLLEPKSTKHLVLKHSEIDELFTFSKKLSHDDRIAFEERLSQDPLLVLKPQQQNVYKQFLLQEQDRRLQVTSSISHCLQVMTALDSYIQGFVKQTCMEPSECLVLALFELCKCCVISIRELAADLLLKLAQHFNIYYPIVEASIRVCFSLAVKDNTVVMSNDRLIDHPESLQSILGRSLAMMTSSRITLNHVIELFFSLPLLDHLLLIFSPGTPAFLVQQVIKTNQYISNAREIVLKFAESEHMQLPRQKLTDILISHFISTQLPLVQDALCSLISNSNYETASSLVKYMTHDDVTVRIAATSAILALPAELFNHLNLSSQCSTLCIQSQEQFKQPPIHLAAFVMSHDDVAEVAKLAKNLFDQLPWPRDLLSRSKARLTSYFAPFLIDLLVNKHCSSLILQLSANAFSSLIFFHFNDACTDISELMYHYTQLLDKVYPPLSDKELETLGLGQEQRQKVPVSVANDGTSEHRRAVAVAFGKLAGKVPVRILTELLTFLLKKVLADPVMDVVETAVQSGSSIIKSLSEKEVDDVYNILSSSLDSLDPSKPDSNKKRVGIVVWLGSLSVHLEANDPRVLSIISNLLSTLSTHVVFVQTAVSESLSAVIKLVDSEEQDKIVGQMKENLQSLTSSAQRAGASHGIAGVVAGLGVTALKHYEIMDLVTTLIGDPERQLRESALLTVECLSKSLGIMYEPYVINFIPKLLATLSDTSPEVRDQAVATSAAIVKKITIPGVKMILPPIINSLDATLWRTKVGAVTLIQTFVSVAPVQISSALPNIIPKLATLVVDPHIRVAESAEGCLKTISNIITVPDLKPLATELISAICEPASKTASALKKLSTAALESSIDAPSLSLLIPVINRGMSLRSFEAKQNACLVLTEVVKLSSAKNLAAYVPQIINDIKQVIIDPIPSVRHVAASLCYNLGKKLSIKTLSSLYEWAQASFTNDPLTVTRNGTAMCYAALSASGGSKVLDGVIQEMAGILTTAVSSQVAKDGAVQVLHYLPHHYSSKKFARYVTDVMPLLISCFQGEAEFLRDSAIKATKSFVKFYLAPQSPFSALFLRAINTALIHHNWRARFCATSIIFDVLLALGNLKLKRETEAQEISLPDHEVLKIEKSIGRSDYFSVVSRLLFVKCDENDVVKQSAVNVWKALVRNTARTIKLIFPTFISEVLLPLIGENRGDIRSTLISVVDEISVKYHAELFDLTLPPLLDFMNSSQSTSSELTGAAMLVSSVVRHVTPAEVMTVAEMEDSPLIMAIQQNLLHESPAVREATALATSAVITKTGDVGAQMILPEILRKIQIDDEHEKKIAISALSDLLSHNVSLLNTLVPQLLRSHSADNIMAIASLISVSQESYKPYLEATLSLIVSLIGFDPSTTKTSAEINKKVESITSNLHLVSALVNSIDPALASTLVGLLFAYLNAENPIKKITACYICQQFALPDLTDLDESRDHLINDLLRGVLPLLLTDTNLLEILQLLLLQSFSPQSPKTITVTCSQ